MKSQKKATKQYFHPHTGKPVKRHWLEGQVKRLKKELNEKGRSFGGALKYGSELALYEKALGREPSMKMWLEGDSKRQVLNFSTVKVDKNGKVSMDCNDVRTVWDEVGEAQDNVCFLSWDGWDLVRCEVIEQRPPEELKDQYRPLTGTEWQSFIDHLDATPKLKKACWLAYETFGTTDGKDPKKVQEALKALREALDACKQNTKETDT